MISVHSTHCQHVGGCAVHQAEEDSSEGKAANTKDSSAALGGSSSSSQAANHILALEHVAARFESLSSVPHLW